MEAKIRKIRSPSAMFSAGCKRKPLTSKELPTVGVNSALKSSPNYSRLGEFVIS